MHRFHPTHTDTDPAYLVLCCAECSMLKLAALYFLRKSHFFFSKHLHLPFNMPKACST